MGSIAPRCVAQRNSAHLPASLVLGYVHLAHALGVFLGALEVQVVEDL